MSVRHLSRPLAAVLCCGALAHGPVHGRTQNPDAPPAPVAFDAASVKLNTSGDSRSGTELSPGGRVTILNKSLRSLVPMAYGSADMEVIGGPGWIDSDRWNIQAVPPPDTQGTEHWPAMLKTLLADRFLLRAHVEQRERAVYRLVRARSDGRLGTALTPTACAADDAGCGNTSANTSGTRRGTITARGRTLEEFAITISSYAERRVFDATGLDGRYDLQLEWSEDLSIFTAIQEQLGLKLEPARDSVDVLIVDQVTRPAPD